MPGKAKNVLLVTVSVLAIAASAVWIYYRELRAPQHNVALHQQVGAVLAEQTAKLVGPKGRLLLLTIPTAGQPELKTQLEAFRRALKHLGNYDVKEHEFDTKDQPKYGPGSGISSRRFLRAVKNHPGVDAIISFVGAPKVSAADLAEAGRMPKFIAECRSPDHLPALFEKHVLEAAVVARFTFPAPGPLKPSSPQEWFDKRYQVLTAETASSIPKVEGE